MIYFQDYQSLIYRKIFWCFVLKLPVKQRNEALAQLCSTTAQEKTRWLSWGQMAFNTPRAWLHQSPEPQDARWESRRAVQVTRKKLTCWYRRTFSTELKSYIHCSNSQLKCPAVDISVPVYKPRWHWLNSIKSSILMSCFVIKFSSASLLFCHWNNLIALVL